MGFASFVGLRTGQDRAKALNPMQAAGVDVQGRGLFNSVLATMPESYRKEAKFKPMYADLDLELFRKSLAGLQPQFAGANTASRTADLNDITNLGPGAVNAFRGMNPLNAQLAEDAAMQLAMGGQLNPNDAYRITQSVRGDWANRGLGNSAPAGLEEALQLYGGGEQLRQSRQQFAQSVAGNENSAVLPWLTQRSDVMGAAGQLAAGAGPTLSNSNQAANLVGQVFGAYNQNNQITSQNSVAAHNNINDNATSAFTSSA